MVVVSMGAMYVVPLSFLEPPQVWCRLLKLLIETPQHLRLAEVAEQVRHPPGGPHAVGGEDHTSIPRLLLPSPAHSSSGEGVESPAQGERVRETGLWSRRGSGQ